MRVYYFGCNEQAGHYMHEPNMVHRSVDTERGRFLYDNPWGLYIDGDLCMEGKRQIEGEALIHHKDDWTAMAFWDRSVDTRPGSNSVFLAEGTFNFDEMMALAKEYFPQVLNRISFTIREAK